MTMFAVLSKKIESIVCVLINMKISNFMLKLHEHEKKFITTGPDVLYNCHAFDQILSICCIVLYMLKSYWNKYCLHLLVHVDLYVRTRLALFSRLILLLVTM